MGSNAIGWKIIRNTVANRMLDFSLIHKLIPSTRVRRRCKAMNKVIKRQYNLKSYSQYVKMKTDILREETDDDDTDISDTFSDNDYNISYKTKSALTALTPDKNDTVPHTTNENAVTKKVRNRVKVKNLGWQKVKKKSKNISNDTNENISHQSSIINQRTDHSGIKEGSSLIQDSESLEDNEMCNTEKGAQLNVKVTNSNEAMPDVTKTPQSTNNRKEPMEQINKVNERLQSDEDYYCEAFDSHEKQTVEGIKKDLIPLLDDINEAKDEIDNQFVDAKVCMHESHSSSSEKNTNDQGTSADEGRTHKSSNTQPLHLNNTNQPKDSGIEEDTEEEVLANKSKNLTKSMNKLPKIRSVSSNSNDYLHLEDHNASDNIDSKDRKMVLDKGIHNNKDHQENVQKDKPQPRVTYTETVNTKYKVMSRDAPFVNNCTNSDLSLNDFDDKEAFGTQEIIRSIEDSVSPLANKRLQQLRRLNLTVESESSLSEDDNSTYNAEIMNSSLLRRSRESPDISDNENNNVKSKLTMLVQFGKKSEKNKSSRIEDNKKENTIQSVTDIEKHTKSKKRKKRKKRKESKDEESVQPLEYTKFNCDSYKSDRKEYNETEECNNENRPVENVIQVLNEQNTAIRDRPYNLQQLINEDGLVPQTMRPSFTFRDICEDDIFILDIPSMAFEKHLLGKKMILTEKKLKLGKQKYKIEYKNIGSISCIFGRKKSHKPCKTVNIKPTARIVTREKIIKTSLLKSANQYINDERNHIEDDNEIENKGTSSKRHIEMEHKVPFKRKRYSDTIK